MTQARNTIPCFWTLPRANSLLPPHQLGTFYLIPSQLFREAGCQERKNRWLLATRECQIAHNAPERASCNEVRSRRRDSPLSCTAGCRLNLFRFRGHFSGTFCFHSTVGRWRGLMSCLPDKAACRKCRGLTMCTNTCTRVHACIHTCAHTYPATHKPTYTHTFLSPAAFSAHHQAVPSTDR